VNGFPQPGKWHKCLLGVPCIPAGRRDDGRGFGGILCRALCWYCAVMSVEGSGGTADDTESLGVSSACVYCIPVADPASVVAVHSEWLREFPDMGLKVRTLNSAPPWL